VGGDATVDLEVEMDVGTLELSVAEGANVTLTIPRGAVGSVIIDVPSGAGVRLEVEEGDIGGVNVPHDFIQVEEGSRDILGDEGVWESPNYASADYQITILIEEMDIGSVTVR
jgi:hypothetical protein